MIDGIPYEQLYKIIETDGHPTKWKPEPDWNIYFYFGPSSKVQVKYLLEHMSGYGSPKMFFDPDDDPREKYGGLQLREPLLNSFATHSQHFFSKGPSCSGIIVSVVIHCTSQTNHSLFDVSKERKDGETPPSGRGPAISGAERIQQSAEHR